MHANKFIAMTSAVVLAATPLLQAVPIEAYRAYVRGLYAARSGDTETAIREYRNVVRMDKDALNVTKDLVILYWQAGRVDDALSAAKTLETSYPDNVSLQLFLGSFYLLSGNLASAKTAWERVLKIEPDNENALLYLAAYHASDNKPEKAVEYWGKFVKKEPDSAEGYFQLGVSQEKLGQLDKARESFNKTISLKPDSPEAYLALARLYEKEQKLLAAAEEYERYLQLVPDNTTVLLYLGGLYYRIKNFTAAENVFQRAKTQNPKDLTVHFWLGVLAEERKDWDAAIENFEALRANEETPAILLRLSYYYSSKKQHRTAVDYLKKAAVLEPRSSQIRYLLGIAYFDMRKYGDAEKSFRESLALKPDSDETHFYLGVLYDQWGKFDRAVPEFEKAIALNPQYAQAMNYLAYSYIDRKQKLSVAEELLNRALAIDPENGSFIDSLGWLYYQRGDFAAAEKELTKALSRYSDPVIWEHLGDTHRKLNRVSDAWDDYQKALDLNPRHAPALKKIKEIRNQLMPGTLQRKVLNRAVGSILQLSTLRASFETQGESSEYNYRAIGLFHYQRPEAWRIDVLGNFLAPQLIIIHNQGLTVYPDSLADNVGANAPLLDRIQSYLNSGLLEEFDNDTTVTREKGQSYVYENGDKTLIIDKKDSTVREYRVKDQLTVRFSRYEQHDGIFLPGEMQVISRAQNVYVRVKLRQFKVNQGINPSVFTSINPAENP